ncbi:uncharacterized protein BCR38DRAFT_316389, partial [Pseudomassariella vexata]
SFTSRHRSGRPKALTIREARYITRIVRRTPRISWALLSKADREYIGRSLS